MAVHRLREVQAVYEDNAVVKKVLDEDGGGSTMPSVWVRPCGHASGGDWRPSVPVIFRGLARAGSLGT